ncbi:MAG TPA: ABC transporter permease [Tepidisphaeraceae bacterium]|nr:ABC transporter permease [Tepidisphaeraceae bacterium]
MYCTYTLTISCLKMFLRNRQAIFFSLFMPTMILFIFGSMGGDSSRKLQIGLVTHSPDAATAILLDHLRAIPAFIIYDGSLSAELDEMSRGNRTAVVDVPDHLMSAAKSRRPQLSVYANAGQPIESGTVMSILNQFAEKAAMSVAGIDPLFAIHQQSVTAHNFRYIEFLLPGIIAMAVMQMSVFSVAFVFAQYREKGVLKRLLATPMRPYQFVTANIITRLLMSVAQAAIFVVMGVKFFHVPMAGSYWLLAVCVVLGALMFLGLGFTVSGLSKDLETVPVLANITVFPMLFLGNVFFSASNLPNWMQPVADHLPLTYFANAMRSVITHGLGAAEIKHELIGMTIWAALLITLATATFRFSGREMD